MSRHKRKPPARTPNSFKSLDIVCTGRRTHSRNRLGRVRVWVELQQVRRKEGPAPWHQAYGDDPHATRTYRCERCSRVVPLKDETADEILIQLAAKGESQLDISALHVM